LGKTDAELYRLNREEHKSFAELAREEGTTRSAIAGRIRRYGQRLKQQSELSAQNQPETSEQVTLEGSGNTREAESKSQRITTLEQLIDHCKIDLDEWAIERHVINKWEVGVKEPVTGAVLVEPLFQVKAWLVKRKPEAIHPVLSPVNINVKFGKTVQRAKGLRAALVLPDPQFGFSRDVYGGRLTPFHDRLALDVVRQIAQIVEPEISVFLGDVNDFSGWSDKYIRRPEFYFTTQPALIEAAWYIAQIRAATRCEVYDLEGNHDLRPETQIISHLMEAYQLKSADCLEASPVMSIDNLLGLSRMGVTYVPGYPNGEVWINETTRCIHGEKVRGQPGQTAAAVVRDANETVIFGHVHRSEFATKTIPCRDGYRTVKAYSPGCLCHVDGRVPGSSKSNQWQQGAAVIWYDERNSTIVPLDIMAGRAVYNGELYQGCDYVDDLRKDSRWMQF
jgi:hypothetical protein